MAIKIIKKGTAAIELNKELCRMVTEGWAKGGRDLPGYLNGLNAPVADGSEVIASELAFLRNVARRMQ